jgi:hypothetical protein
MRLPLRANPMTPAQRPRALLALSERWQAADILPRTPATAHQLFAARMPPDSFFMNDTIVVTPTTLIQKTTLNARPDL